MMDIGGAGTMGERPVGGRGRGGGRGGGGPPTWPTCEFCNNKFSAGSIQAHMQKCRDRPDFAAEAELTRLEGPKPESQAHWVACPNCGVKYGPFALGPHARRCIKLSPYGRNGFGSGAPPEKGFFAALFGADEIAEMTGLSSQEIARLQKLFERFDTSKNGTLEAPELVKMLKECFPARAAEATSLLAEFQVADLDGDGRCDFGEFCRYYVILSEDYGTGGMSDEELMKLRVLFQRFDEDGDGQLVEKELATLLRQCFPKRAPSVKRLLQEFNVADLNGDGLVGFEEFVKYHGLLRDHGAEISAEAEMFHFFDTDASGSLDRGEFLALLHQLFPENCDDNEELVDREFGSADTNGSKGVDFGEFTAYYERLKTLYERTNLEREVAEAVEEADVAERAAANAAAKAKAAAEAAKAVGAASDDESRSVALAALKVAKAAAKAAAWTCARARVVSCRWRRWSSSTLTS